ncbi:hypothetical protein [Sphingobacterium sp.]|uniref:hypothetical protein n=1 Tax=Sphingobacterium sp. TaxID=341027 RepID=UPI0028968E57|nr:hypothetical protein [Sphingobacterium sp.]
MKPKKKKKKGSGQSAKRTLPREKRLQSAKQWLLGYEGEHLVRAYSKRFRVDKVCAISELRMLGVTISEEYETAVKRSMTDELMQKQKRKEARTKNNALGMVIEQDDNFAFIIGRTSSGFPYGVQWDELPMEERVLFSNEEE